jgi:hypothetical protein
MVRYTVKPDRISENVDLVKAVYEELHRERPDGLRYATFHDGSGGFVHVAAVEEGREPHPLSSQPAFKTFLAEIVDRCAIAPEATDVEAVGSFRLFEGVAE